VVERAYQPYEPARRPGQKPEDRPKFRVLVHRQYREAWENISERCGLENAQQFWDHVAHTPGEAPAVGRSSFLRGKAGKARFGGSKTIHYEITGAGRINYQWCEDYKTSPEGDPHPCVFIMTIDMNSH
jgi:hypothetical protein